MRKTFQVHRLRVEDTQEASSVVGRVTGMVLDGTGFVSGGIETLHSSNLFSNGRAYSLVQVMTKLPIRRHDDLLVVCRQGRNGVWIVLSVLNRSNGTSYQHSVVLPLLYLWGVFILSLITIFLVIGIVLAPLMLFVAGKFTLIDFPQILSANRALSRIASLGSDDKMDREIDAFNHSKAEFLFGSIAAR